MLVRAQGSTDGGATWQWLKVDSDGHLQADILSIAGGSLLFKYESQVSGLSQNLNAAAGTVTLNSSAVPANRLWVIKFAAAYNTVSAITKISIGYDVSGVLWVNNVILGPAIDQPVVSNGEMILIEGNKVSAVFDGCVAGDDIYLAINGYRITL